MGWITVEQIQIYSISKDISDLTTLIFNLIMDLFNPFFLFVIILFIVSMIIYILWNIRKNIENTGQVN